MSHIKYNPFLEGSVEVPEEEIAAAAYALVEEAAAIRSKADQIRERATEARILKEAARKAEIARMEAKVEATRALIIKTVANIPKASERQTLRPVPPNLETTGPNSSIASGSGSFFSLDYPVSTLDLAADIVVAAVAATFTLLIFNNL